MWHKTIVFFLLVSCVLAADSTSMQQDGNSSSFSVSVNLVKVPFSVFDPAGNLVTSLDKEHFRIWEDQAPQEIRSFGLDINPVSVVLLLDTSQSGKSELKKIKEAAEEFVAALSPEDRFSLITFDDEVNLRLDWTDNKKKLRSALGKIRQGMKTALYDAMYIAAAEQLKGIDGRKAIILLTDCINNLSVVEFEEAAQSVVQSQASLYVVSKTVMMREEAKKDRRVVMITDIYVKLFGTDDNYVEEFFKKREAQMAELAEKTGGRSFFPADYDKIKSAYSEIARELKSKYYLTYVSNQQLAPNTYHRIAVEYLQPAGKIIHRKGYYYLPRPMNRLIR